MLSFAVFSRNAAMLHQLYTPSSSFVFYVRELLLQVKAGRSHPPVAKGISRERVFTARRPPAAAPHNCHGNSAGTLLSPHAQHLIFGHWRRNREFW